MNEPDRHYAVMLPSGEYLTPQRVSMFPPTSDELLTLEDAKRLQATAPGLKITRILPEKET